MSEIIPFDSQLPIRRRSVINVLVVASQELIRDVMRSKLSCIDGVHVVGESNHGEAAMRAMEELRPDVAIIESQIGPEAEGVRCGYRFKAARPSVGIVVMSEGFSRDVSQCLTVKTGSGWSFITRSAALEPQRLWRAIERAAHGSGVIDAGVERSAASSSAPLLERLTVEQARALELLAAGVSDAGIAARLALTQSETHNLIESLLEDMHIDHNPRIDRRVVATLVYLRETVRMRD